MILTLIISTLLTLPMEKEETKAAIRFNEMVLVEETTLPKPSITAKR